MRVAALGGEVEVVVTDDGIGVDESARERGGLGLDNMRARAERRGGHFEIAADPAGGSTLRWTASLD